MTITSIFKSTLSSAEVPNQSHHCIIATANLLNLANPNRVFYANTPVYTQTQYQNKVCALADLLVRLQADIIGVQEVWDEAALADICNAAGMASFQRYVPLASNELTSKLTQGQGASGTPAVGLVSRYPILDSKVLTAIPKLAQLDVPDMGRYEQFNRPPVWAKVQLPNGKLLTVIVAHLKSQRPHYLEDAQGQPLEEVNDPHIRVRAKLRSLCMRAAEAAGIRQYVIDALAHNHEPLVLLGDMNDVLSSVTCQLLSEAGEGQFDKANRDIILYDAATIATRNPWLRDKAYSHIHQGMPEVLDHILLSEQFLPDSKFAMAEVLQVDYFNDHLSFVHEQRPTDHGLVRAQLKLH